MDRNSIAYPKMKSTTLIVVLNIIFLAGLSRGEHATLRVYGGKESEIEEIPYIVSIMHNNVHICGGTILNTEWVITAAHCVANKTDLEVYAGLVDMMAPNNNTQLSSVAEVVLHPHFVPGKRTLINDIALLRLETILEMNNGISAIPIIGENELRNLIDNGAPGMLSGWGANEMSMLSNVLYTGSVKLLRDEECLQKHNDQECGQYEPGAHLCSEIDEPARAAGLLDDGGPVVLGNKLAGIILHGKNLRDRMCMYSNSIYASVPYHKKFIEYYIPDLFVEENNHNNNDADEKADNGYTTDILLEFNIVFKSSDEINSLIDSVKCNPIDSYSFSIEDKKFVSQPNGQTNDNMNPMTQVGDELNEYTISIKFVKSESRPETGFSFNLLGCSFITPYISIRRSG